MSWLVKAAALPGFIVSLGNTVVVITGEGHCFRFSPRYDKNAAPCGAA
jgi:hypothetical protein